MNYKKTIIFFLFFFIGSIAAWDYKNVDSWKDEFPQCGGKQQSPINLDQIGLSDDAGEELNFKRYYNKPVRMTLSSNGHILEVKPEWDEALGPPILTVQGTEYHLQLLQFHWGPSNDNGSEHILPNNLRAPLEMHIVHYNPEFGDFDLENGDAILVVGILFKRGIYSNTLWRILDYVYDDQEPEFSGVEMEPFPISFFFYERSFDYYISYTGSLTTPPCSEGVTWIVLIPPMQVSATQMKIFRSIKLKHDDHNNRPVQPINDRKPGKKGVLIY